MPDTITRRMATLQEAALYLQCHERTVRRYIASGEFTGYRLGRKIRVDLNEVDAAMRIIPAAKAG